MNTITSNCVVHVVVVIDGGGAAADVQATFQVNIKEASFAACYWYLNNFLVVRAKLYMATTSSFPLFFSPQKLCCCCFLVIKTMNEWILFRSFSGSAFVLFFRLILFCCLLHWTEWLRDSKNCSFATTDCCQRWRGYCFFVFVVLIGCIPFRLLRG